jgi:hypothetical protein
MNFDCLGSATVPVAPFRVSRNGIDDDVFGEDAEYGRRDACAPHFQMVAVAMVAVCKDP